MSAIKTFGVPYRHLMCENLERVCRDFDILFRLSELAPLGAAARLTGSDWSHAALVYIADGVGTVVLEGEETPILDWLELCGGGRFALYRGERLVAEGNAQTGAWLEAA